MPNILKIRLPATANALSTIAHVYAARRAISLFSSCGESEVIAINSGITANGSTRKKIDVAARSANSSTEIREDGIVRRTNARKLRDSKRLKITRSRAAE
jgi:hypothetical protein